MDMLFGVLCAVIGVLLASILGLQFYKLGKSLKPRFPIIYRLYVITWCIVAALFLIVILMVSKDAYDRQQNQKSINSLNADMGGNYESEAQRYADEAQRAADEAEIVVRNLEETQYSDDDQFDSY